jgi:hypothetical protein
MGGDRVLQEAAYFLLSWKEDERLEIILEDRECSMDVRCSLASDDSPVE